VENWRSSTEEIIDPQLIIPSPISYIYLQNPDDHALRVDDHNDVKALLLLLRHLD